MIDSIYNNCGFANQEFFKINNQVNLDFALIFVNETDYCLWQSSTSGRAVRAIRAVRIGKTKEDHTSPFWLFVTHVGLSPGTFTMPARTTGLQSAPRGNFHPNWRANLIHLHCGQRLLPCSNKGRQHFRRVVLYFL